MSNLKLFNQTFKVLVVITVCIWAIYIMVLLFAGTKGACASGAATRLVNQFAWLAGIFSAPPIAYGLTRLLLWPNGTLKANKGSGWLIGSGAAVFVGALTLFALLISQYGCP